MGWELIIPRLVAKAGATIFFYLNLKGVLFIPLPYLVGERLFHHRSNNAISWFRELHTDTDSHVMYEGLQTYISADITPALISQVLLNKTNKILEQTCNAVPLMTHVEVIPGILQAISEATFNYWSLITGLFILKNLSLLSLAF